MNVGTTCWIHTVGNLVYNISLYRRYSWKHLCDHYFTWLYTLSLFILYKKEKENGLRWKNFAVKFFLCLLNDILDRYIVRSSFPHHLKAGSYVFTRRRWISCHHWEAKISVFWVPCVCVAKRGGAIQLPGLLFLTRFGAVIYVPLSPVI